MPVHLFTVIQSQKLKSVGKNAFQGISKKAKVPKKKLAAYKKLTENTESFLKNSERHRKQNGEQTDKDRDLRR